jgi:hypothetical protein
MMSGCGLPVVAGLTVTELATAGSLASTAATGKGFGEYAMDAATGRDCRIFEGIFRKDRHVCERKSSPALEDDWKGFFGSPVDPVVAGPTEDPGSEGRSRRVDTAALD